MTNYFWVKSDWVNSQQNSTIRHEIIHHRNISVRKQKEWEKKSKKTTRISVLLLEKKFFCCVVRVYRNEVATAKITSPVVTVRPLLPHLFNSSPNKTVVKVRVCIQTKIDWFNSRDIKTKQEACANYWKTPQSATCASRLYAHATLDVEQHKKNRSLMSFFDKIAIRKEMNS